MALPTPPAEYSLAYMQQLLQAIQTALNGKHDKGRDLEVGRSAKLILTDVADGERYSVEVDNGVLGVDGPL